MQAISSHFSDRTRLVISHRVPTVMSCDGIFVIGDGKVVETGAPQDLLRKENGVFAKMHSVQSQQRCPSDH